MDCMKIKIFSLAPVSFEIKQKKNITRNVNKLNSFVFIIVADIYFFGKFIVVGVETRAVHEYFLGICLLNE